MSDLRDQLRQARAEHRSARYPGDLAAELLPPRRATDRPRWFLSTAVGGMAAAAAVLAVVHRTAGPGGDGRAAPGPHPFAAREDAPAPTPVVYALPTRVPLTLPVAPLMPTSPPVVVSLDGFPANLGPLQQSYQELPKLMRQFNRHGFGTPAGEPAPEKRSALPEPASAQSA